MLCLLPVLRRAWARRGEQAPSASKRPTRAAQRAMELLWLPKPGVECNAMDQLWRELQGPISAQYPYPTIDEYAAAAEQWLGSLTPIEALRKAGIRSKHSQL